MGFLSDWLGKKADTSEIVDAITAKTQSAIYYKELAKHIAVSYIANTISKCEFKVYENGAEVKNELYYALNVAPNPNQNSSEFLNKLIQTLYRKNEALVVPINDKLYVADGYSIEERQLKENMFRNISVEQKSIRKSYKASDVFYWKLDEKSIDTLVNGLYDIYGQVIQSALNAFRRGNGQKYRLMLDQMRAGEPKFVEQYNTIIKEQLQEFIEADDAVFPEYKGYTLNTLGESKQSSSGEIINIRKEIFDVIAEAYKIPLPMMYCDVDNLDQVVNVFLTFCIDPLADRLEEELTRKTNTFATWNGGKNYVQVDTTCIKHIDIFEIAPQADKLIGDGMYSIDELRVKVGDVPLNSEFSRKHWITKNYSDVEDINNSAEGGE